MCQDSPYKHRRFLFKDLYDQGLAAATGTIVDTSAQSSDILVAVKAMDQAISADGTPNYDLHIWMALCRLMINAGDVLLAAVEANVVWNPALQRGVKWSFGYNVDPGILDMNAEELAQRLPGYSLVDPFVEITVLEHVLEPKDDLQEWIDTFNPGRLHGDGFATKAMGGIDPSQYMVKLDSYPMMVHPKLRQRAVGTIATMIAIWLAETGVTIRQFWIPEDTSKGFARYILSDGIEHYQLDFHGPLLAYLMAKLDAYSDRSEEEGAVILDDLPAKETDLTASNPELPN